jgi:phosphomethylpyrimidine synthase
MVTQLAAAKAGEKTRQIQFVAKTENIPPQTVCKEVAQGRMVIPANKIHIEKNLKPIGIGRAASIKVNANIGTSSA